MGKGQGRARKTSDAVRRAPTTIKSPLELALGWHFRVWQERKVFFIIKSTASGPRTPGDGLLGWMKKIEKGPDGRLVRGRGQQAPVLFLVSRSCLCPVLVPSFSPPRHAFQP